MDRTADSYGACASAAHANAALFSLVDSDPLRKERLTRSLRDLLAGIDSVAVEWLEPSDSEQSGAKGTAGPADLLLAVSCVRVVLPLVVRAVEAWLKAHSDQVLIVEHKGTKVEVRGARGSRDLELLSKVLER